MNEQNLVNITQTYYDSQDADEFYYRIWGGEDIHVGIYQEGDRIADASRRTVRTMAEKALPLDAQTHVLDIGAGYGGAARFLASTYGCRVTCLNLSAVENERNRQKNQEMGLSELISVVDGNFEALPFEDRSFEVIWSEDAILHSGEKEKVLTEAFRVAKPGAKMVFSDPMQADECPDGVLEPVLARIHLKEMGSVKRYREMGQKVGWQDFETWEMPEQLINHYSRVRAELEAQYESLKPHVSEAYLERMKAGLGHWIEGGNKGYLNWGIIRMAKP